MTEKTELNEEIDVLDAGLDELVDLKELQPFPVGTYRVLIDWEEREINNFPAMSLKMKNLEVVELKNATDTPPEEGEVTSILFMLRKKDGTRNTIGEGQIKEVIKVLHPVFGGATNRETISASKGAEIYVTLGIRANKENPEQKFNQIKAVMLEI